MSLPFVTQEHMHYPIAFNAEMIGDIMYLYEALKQDGSLNSSRQCRKLVITMTKDTWNLLIKQGSRGSHTIAISMGY